MLKYKGPINGNEFVNYCTYISRSTNNFDTSPILCKPSSAEELRCYSPAEFMNRGTASDLEFQYLINKGPAESHLDQPSLLFRYDQDLSEPDIDLYFNTVCGTERSNSNDHNWLFVTPTDAKVYGVIRNTGQIQYSLVQANSDRIYGSSAFSPDGIKFQPPVISQYEGRDIKMCLSFNVVIMLSNLKFKSFNSNSFNSYFMHAFGYNLNNLAVPSTNMMTMLDQGQSQQSLFKVFDGTYTTWAKSFNEENPNIIISSDYYSKSGSLSYIVIKGSSYTVNTNVCTADLTASAMTVPIFAFDMNNMTFNFNGVTPSMRISHSICLETSPR